MKKEIFLALKVHPLCFSAPQGPSQWPILIQGLETGHGIITLEKEEFSWGLELLPFCGLLISCDFQKPAWDKRQGWEDSLQLCKQTAVLHIPPYSKYRFGVRSSLPTHANSTPLSTQRIPENTDCTKSYSYNILSHVCYCVDPECPQKTCTESVVLSPDAKGAHFRRSGLVGRS